MQIRTFTLDLPWETTRAEVDQAGKNYLETLHLSSVADYSYKGRTPHKTMPRMGVFSYSYKA
jgi:hypothetical protein